MYAVIRAGGKQYRVAPGDVIRVEKLPAGDGRMVEFAEVLAVSGQDGQIGRPADSRVVGQVVEEGRADKILVFHYKRKKQYKRLRGHRQPFTAVRITEIAFDGQKFSAPEQQERKTRPRAERASSEAQPAPVAEAAPEARAAKKSAGKKTGGASSAAKKSTARKSPGKKK
jgi:large subunit ribosomal protein L21